MQVKETFDRFTYALHAPDGRVDGAPCFGDMLGLLLGVLVDGAAICVLLNVIEIDAADDIEMALRRRLCSVQQPEK